MCSTFKPGNYGQASTGAPSVEELIPPPSSRWDRKKEVLMNTPTLTWAYTRTFKEKGNAAIKLHAVNLNGK
jgi:hypothetical protein